MFAPKNIFAVSAFTLILLSGALMQVSALRIYGVAPNLILVSLVVCSFFTEEPVFFTLLVLAASWIVRVTPTIFDPLAAVTLLIGLAVFWIQRRMVVRGLFGVSLILGISTVAVYAWVNPSFIWLHPGEVLWELIYNLILGFALFEIADRVLGREMRR